LGVCGSGDFALHVFLPYGIAAWITLPARWHWA
jgi:hypothetical protein